ncbi:MAG: 50S ribosomal protein L29 [Bacteroides sp. SM23_62_1]|nr:MAG: 50S ribosomal protein L29 [Bacteroides sp. SM23_62_1]
MKSSELRELTIKELSERLDNERDYLLRLRLNHAISPLDNPMKIRETRQNIAKIVTELNKRHEQPDLPTEKKE